jgi:hypothetical protein
VVAAALSTPTSKFWMTILGSAGGHARSLVVRTSEMGRRGRFAGTIFILPTPFLSYDDPITRDGEASSLLLAAARLTLSSLSSSITASLAAARAHKTHNRPARDRLAAQARGESSRPKSTESESSRRGSLHGRRGARAGPCRGAVRAPAGRRRRRRLRLAPPPRLRPFPRAALRRRARRGRRPRGRTLPAPA